jgi:hypothetical protein
LFWNDLISDSESHVGFSEVCEALFSSRLLALDVIVEYKDISRIWKYTRENMEILDKEVVCYLSYNSIKSGLMKRNVTAKREGKFQLLEHPEQTNGNNGTT